MKKQIQKNIPIILAAFFIITIICLRIFVAIGGKATQLVLSKDAQSALNGFVFNGVMTDGKVTHFLSFNNGKVANRFSAKQISFSSVKTSDAGISFALTDTAARKNAKRVENYNDDYYATTANSADILVELYSTQGRALIDTGMTYEKENLPFAASKYSIDGNLRYNDFFLQQPIINDSALLCAEINDKMFFTMKTNNRITGENAIWRADEFLMNNEIAAIQEKSSVEYMDEKSIPQPTLYGAATKIVKLKEANENYNVIGVFAIDDALALLTQENNKLMATLYDVNGAVLDKQILHNNYAQIVFGESPIITIRNMQNKSEVCINIVSAGETTTNTVVAIKAGNSKITTAISADISSMVDPIYGAVFSQDNQKLLAIGKTIAGKYRLAAEFRIFSKDGSFIFNELINCGVTDDDSGILTTSYRKFYFSHIIDGNKLVSTAKQSTLMVDGGDEND